MDDEEDWEGTGEWDCPTCGAAVYDNTPKCPKCGDYITPGETPSRKAWPWWIWLGLALAAAVVLGWLAQRG